ncbi:MAG: type IV toxin-antitoxin system AbiEi family antitoxin [Bacteroidales bacterium]|nr:type IV toxin-antitoxin system AbiEi family antitoxin [Bacteroidales bacterium]
MFKISSPALTAVDLIHYQTKLGGLNRMLAILEELSEEINENDLAGYKSFPVTRWHQHFPIIPISF